MYDVISRRLKENSITAFNTGSGDRIGVSKSSLSRFIRVGLQRRDVRKIGKDQYEIVPNITDDDTMSEENTLPPCNDTNRLP